MKILRIMTILGFIGILALTIKCSDDDPDVVPPAPDPGESTSELLMKKFETAPVLDGDIDAIWSTAQKLVGTTEVPNLAARGTYLNSDGAGVEEDLGLFFPYSGETQDFTMRGGYVGTDIYILVEWEDSEDSKDRESWYFDATDKLWKQEHKYANAADDKFYEDKFAFLFPVGQVTGFNASTCFASCHQNLTLEKAKDKHTRHYTTVEGEVIDMWHWKRVRGTYNNRIDDQRIVYAEATGSSANGRGGDSGQSGYSDNKQTLTITGTSTDASVPKYIIPDGTDYFWIGEDELDNAAKLVTAVDENGVLEFDGGTIDPSDGGYEQGTGNKRFPSILTRNFEGNRADLSIEVKHTGTGWVAELTRKMNTGDPEDALFDPTEEFPFGFATFNNAAIAHAIKSGLNMKFEQ